ncbi:DEAD/DEAH box helicase [Rhizobium sp. LjRoot254]|uniref:DEAD/DEAH box helicase n=1 Tax=Rhizobium sp. LjRoot254 TaxID=3342297 RepID=UPI003ECC804A
MTSFDTLGLSKHTLPTLEANNFTVATPIQAQAIPHLLLGRDLVGLAQTGTGKTLAFGLPIIEMLLKEGLRAEPKSARALILAPTRELVNQICDSLNMFTRKTPLKITSVVGGQSINKQMQIVGRGVDILVATPGRLLDLCDRRALTLTATRVLVLDEADQMLDLGFIHDLKKIVKMVPKRRQTMLFSATMPAAIADIAENYMESPVEVSVTPPGKAADKVDQQVHFVLGRDHKAQLLKELLRASPDSLSLVFAKTKHGAEKLMTHLAHSGFKASSIHGNKSQGQRDRALKGFRDGEVRVLVATDVAARGIDVPGVSHVFNFDLPTVAESYVHRIGRTARAGREGIAIAFCGPEDVKMLYDIEKLLGTAIPVAGGERPEYQGKKKAGGGEGHRGRRPTGHEQPRAPRENREPRGDRPARGERQTRPQSAFAEVEELNGGEFRPVRESAGEHRGNRGDQGRRDGNPGGRYPGDTRNERGERPVRAEHADGAKRPAQAPKQAQNRHSPARHAGFAGDGNIATNGERTPAAGPDNRNHGKPANGKKRFHGGGNRSNNGGGQGGERRAQSGNRRG